jgi:hypothetical protein
MPKGKRGSNTYISQNEIAKKLTLTVTVNLKCVSLLITAHNPFDFDSNARFTFSFRLFFDVLVSHSCSL